MKIFRSRTVCLPVLNLICLAVAVFVQLTAHAGTAPYATVSSQGQALHEDSSSPGRRAHSRTGAEFEVIESIPEEPTPEIMVDTNAGSAEPGTVDINSASIGELAEVLPGIGPGKAQRIVEWRELNGPFQSIEQLLDVSGIGPVTLENVRPFVRIGELVSMQGELPGPAMREQAVILALTNVIRRVVDDRAAVMLDAESP